MSDAKLDAMLISSTKNLDSQLVNQFSELYELLEYIKAKALAIEAKVEAMDRRIQAVKDSTKSLMGIVEPAKEELRLIERDADDAKDNLKMLLEDNNCEDLELLKNVLEVLSKR